MDESHNIGVFLDLVKYQIIENNIPLHRQVTSFTLGMNHYQFLLVDIALDILMTDDSGANLHNLRILDKDDSSKNGMMITLSNENEILFQKRINDCTNPPDHHLTDCLMNIFDELSSSFDKIIVVLIPYELVRLIQNYCGLPYLILTSDSVLYSLPLWPVLNGNDSRIPETVSSSLQDLYTKCQVKYSRYNDYYPHSSGRRSNNALRFCNPSNLWIARQIQLSLGQPPKSLIPPSSSSKIVHSKQTSGLMNWNYLLESIGKRNNNIMTLQPIGIHFELRKRAINNIMAMRLSIFRECYTATKHENYVLTNDGILTFTCFYALTEIMYYNFEKLTSIRWTLNNDLAFKQCCYIPKWNMALGVLKCYSTYDNDGVDGLRFIELHLDNEYEKDKLVIPSKTLRFPESFISSWNPTLGYDPNSDVLYLLGSNNLLYYKSLIDVDTKWCTLRFESLPSTRTSNQSTNISVQYI